jgi:hypothetical protein
MVSPQLRRSNEKTEDQSEPSFVLARLQNLPWEKKFNEKPRRNPSAGGDSVASIFPAAYLKVFAPAS